MPSTASPPSAPSASRLPRWARSRFLRWGAGGLVAFCLLLVLVYGEENWRGRRAWTVYQAALLARGVEFNWHALEPPPVPEGENFAATPFFAALFDFTPGTYSPRDMAAYNRTAGFAQTGEPFMEQRRGTDFVPAMTERRRTDLAAEWRRFSKPPEQGNPATAARPNEADRALTATALLETLAKFNPVLDELRSASHRPQARFNLNYQEENNWRLPQPHLPVLQRVCTVLLLRASAELALRDAPAAADDVHLLITVADSVRAEPLPASQRARILMLLHARQIIWEGLADRRWSDRQLRDFQTRLQALAPLRDAATPLRLERASVDQLFGQLQHNPVTVRSWRLGPGLGNLVLPYFLSAMPAGWMAQERVSYHHLFQDQLLRALDPAVGKVQPTLVSPSGSRGSPFWNHRLLADLLIQSARSLLMSAALAQSGNDQTILACALERFRLATGQFPPTLDALVPQYLAALPADVISGQPLTYRCLGNGRFQLYSIGWNGQDDGGQAAFNADGKTTDITRGDWVWPQYPDE